MTARFFGQYLLEKGAISAESLLKAVKLQESTNLKLGAYAVKIGAITVQQANQLNNAQRQTDRMFGELAVEQGFLTAAKLQELLDQQAKVHLYIGEALVKVEGITAAALEHELALFQAEQRAQAQGAPVPPADVPQGRQLALLVDVTVKLLRRCADILGRASKVSLDRTAMAAAFLEAVIPFHGELEGRYGLRMSRTLAQMISKGMMGEAVDSDTGLADAVREFCNVVAGNVCSTLASQGAIAEIKPPEHSMPAPPRQVEAGVLMARYTVDTVYGPIAVFFESTQRTARST